MTSAPFLDTLVYLDGTEGSISALMYSIMLAKSTDTRLHVLYVVNTKALGDLVKSHIFVDQEKSEYLMDLKKALVSPNEDFVTMIDADEAEKTRIVSPEEQEAVRLIYPQRISEYASGEKGGAR